MLRISYFAWVREAMGQSEESIAPPADLTTVADLIAWLRRRDADGARAFADPARIRTAIDGVMASADASILGAQEVALFPPVTGG